ncbi:MAG: NADH-quinone oxidoreductase subunit C [Alicyclobacillaceae bacterium]|nr:NADH-quinone oxidoreductase subunit C [Alicyclobacillaceae bacterium]
MSEEERKAETTAPQAPSAASAANRAAGAGESGAKAEAKPAAAKAQAAKAAPPDPRVEAAKAVAEQIKQVLVREFGEAAVEETGVAHRTPMVRVRKQDWPKAVEFLRTHPDWKLNYAECMAGTDYPDYIEIVLYVQSTELGHFVCLKTRTDRDPAEVPSLVASHPGLNWEEREIYDLLGVRFTGHPDLRRIMMWEGFKGHPLRKDYREWD